MNSIFRPSPNNDQQLMWSLARGKKKKKKKVTQRDTEQGRKKGKERKGKERKGKERKKYITHVENMYSVSEVCTIVRF
jgi:hypothetical protein